MTDDVERMRRLAYGPNTTPNDRAAAERALQELTEESQAARPTTPAEPATQAELTPVEDPAAPFDPGDETVETDADSDADGSVWHRRIRVGWLIPIVVGSLLMGVAGALSATGQLDRVSVPGISLPPAGPQGASGTGDLAAADAWFDTPASNSDYFPFPELLDSNGIAPENVRFALDGGYGYRVWVARTDRQLCILITKIRENEDANSCFDRDRFVVGGAHLGMDGRNAHWYGHNVSVDPPDPSAEDNATVPPVLGSGPGNVDAANGWFGPSGMSDDVFPDDGMLDGLGVAPDDVTLVGMNGKSSRQLWVAKQGSTGFCLIVTDGTSSQAQCATIEEFQASGLSISDRGFAAYWDGESVSSTD